MGNLTPLSSYNADGTILNTVIVGNKAYLATVPLMMLMGVFHFRPHINQVI
jgi:hypothetical protein